MTTIEQLNTKGTLKHGQPVNPSWRLYNTEAHGWAVRDINHFEWRAVLLKDGEKELHDKDEAIKFLDDNGIKWHEYIGDE